MIQFFLSKVTVSILSLLLIAVAIGYFLYFDQAAYDTQAKEIANFVASRIDEIASENMQMKVLFVYNDSQGVQLPAKVGDQYYTLEIGTRAIVIRLEGKNTFGYASYIHRSIYTFNPSILKGKKVTSEMLEHYQLSHTPLYSHTQAFYVEQKYMLVDGLWTYVTFVYLKNAK